MSEPREALLQPGDVVETVFWRNDGQRREQFPFRATHINGVRITKILLCADPTIQAGNPSRAKVTRITRPKSDARGVIEVEYLGPIDFELDPDIYVDKSIGRRLQILLEAGFSILLDGPQGSGKTVLSRAIADALGMTYVYFNCASVFEATDFIAPLQVRASETGVAETVFLPTNFCKALKEAIRHRKHRYLIFLDEFNRCRPMARNGLMPALDSTRKVFDPSTNELLDIPENVQFVAAINNGPQFAGASAVDPAQMDRFATIKLTYPPPEEEEKILRKRFPSLSEVMVHAVVHVADAVRGDEALGLDLSMRATQEACVLLSHPYFADDLRPMAALREAFETSYCGRFAGTVDDESTEAGMVWQIVDMKLRNFSKKL